MTDLTQPQFTIARVAQAGDVHPDTIRRWYQRGVLTLGEEDVEADGVGLARTFTGATALTIAIMGALIKRGTAPGLAASAGLAYGHQSADFLRRLPGHLFPDGQTLLVVGADFQILNVSDETLLSEIMRDEALTLLPLDDLVDRVRCRLGLERDPRTASNKRSAASADKPRARREKAMA